MADWDMNFTDPQETNIPSVNESQTPEQVDAQVIPEQPPVNEPQAPEQIEAKTIPEQPFTAQPTAQQQPLFTPLSGHDISFLNDCLRY